MYQRTGYDYLILESVRIAEQSVEETSLADPIRLMCMDDSSLKRIHLYERVDKIKDLKSSIRTHIQIELMTCEVISVFGSISDTGEDGGHVHATSCPWLDCV